MRTHETCLEYLRALVDLEDRKGRHDAAWVLMTDQWRQLVAGLMLAEAGQGPRPDLRLVALIASGPHPGHPIWDAFVGMHRQLITKPWGVHAIIDDFEVVRTELGSGPLTEVVTVGSLGPTDAVMRFEMLHTPEGWKVNNVVAPPGSFN